MDVYARRRLVAAGGGVLVLILIIFGISQCGDDEPSEFQQIGASGATGATLSAVSKSEFIDQADSICSETNAALISAAEDQADDPAQLASDRYDLVRDQLENLQAIAQPESDADLLNDYLAALDDRIRALRRLMLATEREDDAAAAEAQAEVDAANADVASAAEEFGFDICGTSESGDAQVDPSAGTGTDTGGTAPAPATPATPTTPAPTTPPDTGGDGSGGVGPG